MRVSKIVGEPNVGELETQNTQSDKSPSSALRTNRYIGKAINWGTALWPVAFFLVLTIIMTFPLILDLGHSIVDRNLPDADQNMWNLWWFKTALFDRHTNPFYTDMLYYPYRSTDNPLPLYFHTFQPLNMILALPLVLFSDPHTGPILGFNFLIIFGFTLDGCGMFWLVRYLTRSSGGALIAGILFAFCPLIQNGLQQGQTNLITLGWLPLYLLFLHRFFYASPEHRKRDFTLTVIFLTATAYTDWYLTMYLILATGIFTIVLLIQRPRQWLQILVSMAGLAATWLVLVLPFLIPTIRTSSDSTFQLISGYDYEVRDSLNFWSLFNLFKDTSVKPVPLWQQGTVTYPALLLAILGIIAIKRKASFWLVLVITGLVLALGPYLKINNTFLASETTGIPLPYMLLRHLPFLSISRSPQRFIVLTNLGLAVLGGYGSAWLVNRFTLSANKLWPKLKNPQILASLGFALLAIITIFELSILPQPVNKVETSAFFDKLAAEPGDFAILEIPITGHYIYDHRRMFNQTLHGKKIFGGYLSRKIFDYYLDSSSPFRQFIGIDGQFRHTDILPPLNFQDVIDGLDIHYVVAYKDTDRKRVAAYLKDLIPDPSAVVYDDEYLTAYKVTPSKNPSPQTLMWVGEGWHDAETDPNDKNRRWRWSENQGDIWVRNPQGVKLQFDFNSSTFRGAAHLQVSIDDKPYKTFDLSDRLQNYDVGIIELPPGQHQITFKSDQPGISPVEAGASKTDQRKLAFVIEDLNLSEVK